MAGRAFTAGDDLPFVVHLSSPEKFWRGLLTATERQALATDERFVTREARVRNYDALCAGCERLTPSAADFQLADRLARDFSTKLASADALHLASAKNAGAALATFDARLAEAARGQGVEVALA